MSELTSEQAQGLRQSIRRCEQRAVWPKFPAFLIGGPLHGTKTLIDFLNYRSRSVGWSVRLADQPVATVWYRRTGSYKWVYDGISQEAHRVAPACEVLRFEPSH